MSAVRCEGTTAVSTWRLFQRRYSTNCHSFPVDKVTELYVTALYNELGIYFFHTSNFRHLWCERLISTDIKARNFFQFILLIDIVIFIIEFFLFSHILIYLPSDPKCQNTSRPFQCLWQIADKIYWHYILSFQSFMLQTLSHSKESSFCNDILKVSI